MGSVAITGRDRLPLFALLASEAVSGTGSALSRVAIPWFVLETTHTAALLGLTSGVVSLALVAAGFLGGPVVDRLGFKKTAVAADVGSGVAVALIPLLYLTVGLSFWQLLLLVALATLFGMPGITAHIGLVPALADAARTPKERANAASQSIGHFSSLAGPVLGGVLVAALGARDVIWLDAGSFAVSATILALAVSSPCGRAEVSAKQAVGETPAKDDNWGGYFGRLAEGLRFIRRDPVILRIVAASVVINFAYVPVLTVVLVVYADRVLGGAVDLGLMFGALGAGALVGSVLFGAIGHRLPRRTILASGNAALSLSTWLLLVTTSLPATVAALVLAGLALGPGNPIIYTVTQERTPGSLLGRITGTQLALSNAAVPLGVVLTGYLVDAVGLRFVLVASAVAILAVALFVALSPALASMNESRAPERSRVAGWPR